VEPLMPEEYPRRRRTGERRLATANVSVMTGNMFARPMSRRQVRAMIVFVFSVLTATRLRGPCLGVYGQ